MVDHFKTRACNENPIIASFLKTEAQDYLVPPILDTGAGLGDIAFNAFPEKKAICLDLNPVPEGYPLSENHRRIQMDFFDYFPSEPIHTLLLSHVLQFIDDDPERLNRKIKAINPRYVILVINSNTGMMGKLVQWALDNLEDPNPEVRLAEFPAGYTLVKQIPFEATISCEDFENLAQQVGYLMVADIHEHLGTLVKYLKSELNNKPVFSFGQTIEIYEQEKR